jgi:hypothetical protein
MENGNVLEKQGKDGKQTRHPTKTKEEQDARTSRDEWYIVKNARGINLEC